MKPKKIALKKQEYQTGSHQNKITKKYKNNYWEYRVVKNETTWVSNLVRQFMVEHIQPRKEQIKQIVSNCEGELSIVQYVNEGCNPGLHFEKEEIELLSQKGKSITLHYFREAK